MQHKTDLSFFDRTITMDIGVNTVAAVWSGSAYPAIYEWDVPHLGDEAVFCGALRLNRIIQKHRPKLVIIEGVEVWGDSLKSLTSAKRHNLIDLAYLCGAYRLVVQQFGADVQIINSPEWKGQLTKEATAKRLFLITGFTHKSDHVTDAVAMGVALANRKAWGLGL